MATKYVLEDLQIHIGFSILGLSPSAMKYEMKPEFKEAFDAEIKKLFKDDTKLKWALQLSPTLLPVKEETGSSEDSDVTDLLKSEVDAQQEATANFDPLFPQINATCENTPKGWRRSRVFRATRSGGEDWNLSETVDAYDPTGKIDDAVRSALKSVPIYFDVRWVAKKQ